MLVAGKVARSVAAVVAGPAPTVPYYTGVVSGAWGSGVNVAVPFTAAQNLGAKHMRVDVSTSSTAASLDAYFNAAWPRGVTIMLLAGDDLPSTTTAANVATWATRFGPGGAYWSGKANPLPIKWIEMGNENFYSYKSTNYGPNGTTYANGVAAAYSAIQSAGPIAQQVGLLAQADGNSQTAINAMFTAQPNLKNMVAGWTIHPYAPLSAPIDGTGLVAWPQTRTFGSLVNQGVAWLAANGVTVGPSSPFFITEYGISSKDGVQLDDNYGWPRTITYAQAGAGVTSIDNAIRTTYAGMVRLFCIFRDWDSKATTDPSIGREDWFGTVQFAGAAKGGYTTALHTIMANGS